MDVNPDGGNVVAFGSPFPADRRARLSPNLRPTIRPASAASLPQPGLQPGRCLAARIRCATGSARVCGAHESARACRPGRSGFGADGGRAPRDLAHELAAVDGGLRVRVDHRADARRCADSAPARGHGYARNCRDPAPGGVCRPAVPPPLPTSSVTDALLGRSRRREDPSGSAPDERPLSSAHRAVLAVGEPRVPSAERCKSWLESQIRGESPRR